MSGRISDWQPHRSGSNRIPGCGAVNDPTRAADVLQGLEPLTDQGCRKLEEAAGLA